MKNTGVILVGVASGLVAAVATFAVLNNIQAKTTSDADFIDEVRGEASGSGASDMQTASLAPVGAGDLVPVIEVETNAYDMGIIRNDGVSEGQVMVHNRGKAPLNISKVNTQCGCTKGKMSKEIIPPGESAPLEVTVDPYRIPQFTSTKTLTLFTNDPTSPTVTIDVSAKVDPEISVTPEKLDFGVIQKGAGAEKEIRIVQNTKFPLNINALKLVGQSQYYATGYEEVPPSEWANPDRREFLITAKVLPTAPAGNLRANMILETDIPRLPRFTIPMQLEVKGLYAIEPQVITLRSVEAGQTVADVMKLTGDVPVTVTGVEASNEHLQLTHRAGETPNSVTFDLAISEEPPQRWQRDTWTLTIEADGQEFREEVKVMAIIEGAPTTSSSAVQANPEAAERIKKLREEALNKLRDQAVEDAKAESESATEAAPIPEQ